MIEKVRKIFDKGGTFGTLLTNLSKACDCVTHSVPVAKLYALNFDMNPSNLVSDYLTGRNQKVKTNSSFSWYLDIFQCIPQRSILGPLLFILLLYHLFLFVEETDIMSYAKIASSRKSTFRMVFKQFFKGK